MLKSAKENCGNGSCHTRSLHQALVHFVLSTGEKCHRSCSSAIALISPCGQGQAAAESRKDAGETARSPLPCGQRQGSRRARRASGHPGTHRPVPSRAVPPPGTPLPPAAQPGPRRRRRRPARPLRGPAPGSPRPRPAANSPSWSCSHRPRGFLPIRHRKMAPGLATELLAGQLARGAPATSLRGRDGQREGPRPAEPGEGATGGAGPRGGTTHHRSSPWPCRRTEYPKRVPLPPRKSSGCWVSRL